MQKILKNIMSPAQVGTNRFYKNSLTLKEHLK